MYQELRSPHCGTAAVVLVHYGDPAITLRCIASLEKHVGRGVHIIIVDHDSNDQLGNRISSVMGLPNLRVIRRPNLGFGAGCNAGAEEAIRLGASWLWFLNNDAIVKAPVLEGLREMASKHPLIALWGTFQKDGARLIGSDILPAWFPSPSIPRNPLKQIDADFHILGARETLSGASIFLSVEAWKQLGPWPEWCFLYWEDVAWGLAAHAKGLPMALTNLSITHTRNTTTGRHSPVSTYYGVRNELLLHADLWPRRRLKRVMHSFHLLQKRFFQGNWRMIRPTWHAILDAARNSRFAKPERLSPQKHSRNRR